MSLHGLTSITLGVPDVDAVASYYEDFGPYRVGELADRDDLRLRCSVGCCRTAGPRT